MGTISSPSLRLRLVYSDGESIWDESYNLSGPLTIGAFIKQTQFLKDFPSMDISKMSFGVFGKRHSSSFLLQDQDRVEIYRSLAFDPKASRRRRAIHRQKARNIKKKVPINDSTQSYEATN